MKKILLLIFLILGCDLLSEPQDCLDIFGGTAELDQCGTCDDDPSNDCVPDCAGVWGGDAVVDNCGTCDIDTTNDCVQDCAGEWGGTSWVSDCGCVAEDNSGDECDDCDGIPNGELIVDNCGTCDIDTTNDCVQDCAGEWGGTSWVSDCGCVAEDNSGDECDDCDDVPNGDGTSCYGCTDPTACNFDSSATIFDNSCWYLIENGGCECVDGEAAIADNCNACDSDPINDCVQDCAGAWGGNYELDNCGICDGPGAVYTCGCADIPDGECDCNGNIIDECGICGGDGFNDGECDCAGNILDECSVCGGDGIDDGACDCDGNILDECGECNGDGIDAGACDCAGNIEDCAGVCGGSSIIVTLCEDTDSDGLGNPGSETEGCVDGGRDITDGCELPDLNIFLAEDGSVFYNSSEDIAGFQFNVDGAIINGASGGDAGNAGFTISASETTVIGFSLSGATFGSECGTMVELDLTGEATGLSSIIISDPSGTAIPFVYYIGDDDTELVADCTDEFPDCADNYLDCAGECGGSSVVDECGECGGDGIPDGECDCNGNIVDECGECGGDGIPDDECDCNGNIVDECGECGGDGIDAGACDCDGNIEDCAGICNGSSEVDICGVCGGDGKAFTISFPANIVFFFFYLPI